MSESACTTATVTWGRPLPWDKRSSNWGPPPARTAADMLRIRFMRLFRNWKEATGLSSSAVQITEHPDYLAICVMGDAVVPLLLEQVAAGERHLGVALRRITRANVVTQAMSGDMRAQSQAWLAWGRERGLIK